MNDVIKQLIEEVLLIEYRNFTFHPSWNVDKQQTRVLDKNKEFDKLFLKRINKLATSKDKHSGKTIWTPQGTTISYVLPNKEKKSIIGTEQHENFHMMMNSIRKAHPEIKAIESRVCWYFLSQLSSDQVDLMKVIITGKRHSYEEIIASLLSYVNSPKRRKSLEYKLRKASKDDENEFDLDTKIFKAYKDLSYIIKTTPAEVVLNAISQHAGGDGQ